MSIWATRRKSVYLTAIGGVLAIVIGVPTFFALQKPPSCFDGKQNQGEQGVDCGGSCQLLCSFQTASLSVLWSRTFFVSDGLYNAMAYIENPNINAVAMSVPYRFEVFDSDNVLILERRGVANFTGSGIRPIFEGALPTGGRDPARTFFEFLSPPVWTVKRASSTVVVDSRQLFSPESSPRVEAVVSNPQVYDLRGVEVDVAVFNAADNAIAVSKSVVPLLTAQSAKKIVFTWPRPFPEAVSRIEVTPVVPPQTGVQ